MENTINNRRFTKAETQWSFFLPFAFLLVQYGYGLGNIMLTYCVMFAGYCILKFSKFPTFKPLSVYTIWYVLVFLGTVVIFGHSASRAYIMKLMQILVCGFSVAIIAKHLDKEALYRCWKVLGLIVCAAVAYQFFQIIILHQGVLPIPLLPVKSEVLLRNENWTTLSTRPVAFFTEPSMVVAFLTPVLLFAQQKKEVWVSVIVSVAILMSGSTSGIIALAIMWGVSFFAYKRSLTYKILMILFIVVAIVVFLESSFFDFSLNKIDYELSGVSTNMDVRVLRGWWVYDAFDIRSKLFGISDYDISAYIYGHASDYTWQTGYEENFYLNTAQRILILTGIVGAVLYGWMLIKLWLSSNKAVKPYLAVVIASMFFASNFFTNGLFVMQFIVLLSYLNKFEVENEKYVKNNS